MQGRTGQTCGSVHYSDHQILLWNQPPHGSVDRRPHPAVLAPPHLDGGSVECADCQGAPPHGEYLPWQARQHVSPARVSGRNFGCRLDFVAGPSERTGTVPGRAPASVPTLRSRAV